VGTEGRPLLPSNPLKVLGVVLEEMKRPKMEVVKKWTAQQKGRKKNRVEKLKLRSGGERNVGRDFELFNKSAR